jgi:hypothetical protein
MQQQDTDLGIPASGNFRQADQLTRSTTSSCADCTLRRSFLIYALQTNILSRYNGRSTVQYYLSSRWCFQFSGIQYLTHSAFCEPFGFLKTTAGCLTLRYTGTSHFWVVSFTWIFLVNSRTRVFISEWLLLRVIPQPRWLYLARPSMTSRTLIPGLCVWVKTRWFSPCSHSLGCLAILGDGSMSSHGGRSLSFPHQHIA